MANRQFTDEQIAHFRQWYKEVYGKTLNNRDDAEVALRRELDGEVEKPSGGSGSVRPYKGMGNNVQWSSGTLMPQPKRRAGVSQSGGLYGKHRESMRKQEKEAEKQQRKERRSRQDRADKERDSVKKSINALTKEVNGMVKDQSEGLPGDFHEMNPDEQRAWKNQWVRDTYANRKELTKEALAVMDAENPVKQETPSSERPPGKLLKTGKGDVILSPTGEQNGETVYDVYKKRNGSNSWDKKGISLGEKPNNFIPDDKMGTNKMRMDTFKTAYNKYKRDIGYTGEGGLGSNGVKDRMKKDWGDDWGDVYLDKNGGVKQLYWDGQDGVTDNKDAKLAEDMDNARGLEAPKPEIPWDSGPYFDEEIPEPISPMGPKIKAPSTPRESTVDDMISSPYVREPNTEPLFDGEALVKGLLSPAKKYLDYAKARSEGALQPSEELTPEEEELLRQEEVEEALKQQMLLRERSSEWLGGRTLTPEYYDDEYGII
jgi:hypothetical protein